MWLEPGRVQVGDVLDVVRRFLGRCFRPSVAAEHCASCSDRGDSQHSDSKLVPDRRLLVVANQPMATLIYDDQVPAFVTLLSHVSFRK